MDETTPKVEGDDNVISLKVKDQSGGEIVFKVKRNTKFGKIHAAYCAKKAMEQEYVRLTFEGERLQPEQTPVDFEMEDGDVSLLRGCPLIFVFKFQFKPTRLHISEVQQFSSS